MLALDISYKTMELFKGMEGDGDEVVVIGGPLHEGDLGCNLW